MAVTAAQVKELRQATDAPMMDCKKALTENDGDMEKSTEWLRERGVAKSAKKADLLLLKGLLVLRSLQTSKEQHWKKSTLRRISLPKKDGF